MLVLSTRRARFFLFASLASAALLCGRASAQEKPRHPAFTLVSRFTVTKPDGVREVSETTRHVSADGSVRAVRREADGTVASDYLYRSGAGGFYLDHKGKALVKSHGAPPEAAGEPLPTPEGLRAHPDFAGTEVILGHTAYVVRESHRHSGQRDRDNYFAPELGRTPLKTVRYSGGRVLSVSEPVRVTFGEPDPSLLKAPADYEVRPMAPISAGVLNGKAVSKPAPPYPESARAAGASGVVTVQVVIAEDGTVESAKAVGGHPLLQEAAVEAAKKAKFSPTLLSGQPVKVSGALTYNFVLN